VNLAVLIAISIYVAKFDSHRQFNEYRYQIYVDLCKQFDATNDTSDALANLKAYCEVFKFNNQFLFPRNSNHIFNKLMDQLISDTESLTIVKEEFEEKVRTGEITTHTVPRSLGRQLDIAFKDWPKTENAETLAIKAFRNSKNNVIGFIQDVMIEKDLTKYK
jgi:hypothetical protein